MAPKALLVCLLIVAVALVQAGKHPKANKIKKGEGFLLYSLDFATQIARFIRIISHSK